VRVPGLVGQILAEHVALVGHQEHVVGGRILGEDRHLPLDLDVAGLGDPRGRRVGVGARLDDLGLELRGTAARSAAANA
jgi:hypothetical protein